MKLLVALACAGCVDVANDGSDWHELVATGELAAERGPDPAPRAAPCTLRVATFNVHFADDVDDLAAHILASDYVAHADVLIVQELRRYANEPASRASRLGALLDMTWVYAPAHVVDNGGVHGVAMFSRFPLANPEMRELPYYDQVNAEQRIALRADVMLDGAPLPVVDVHLDTRLAPVDRIRQLDPAIHDVGDRMITGGDLNTLPWVWVDNAVPLTSTQAVVGQESAKIVDDFFAQNHFDRAIDWNVMTFPLPGVSIRLDDLYARDLPVVAGDVEQVGGSDHWPVWFDVQRCEN